MANYKLAQTIAGINPNTGKVETVSVVDGVLQTSSSGEAGGSTTVNFGTKIDDATIPTGGVGNLGWLSAIWKLISDRLPLTLGTKPAAESLSVAIASDQQVSVNTAPAGLITPNRITKSTTAEENLIDAPGVGQKLLVHRVVAYNLSSTAEQTIILKSSDGSFPYPSMIIPLKDKDGFWDSSAPGFELAANTALTVSQSSATLVHYSVQYRVETA